MAKKKDSKEKELRLQKERKNERKLSQKQELRKKPTARKRKEVNWQCSGCNGLYFDAKNPKYKETWIECVECSKIHFHISCAVGHGKFDNDDSDGDFTCSVCFQ